MPPPGKKTGKSSIAEMKEERRREVVSGPTGGSGSVANTGGKDFGISDTTTRVPGGSNNDRPSDNAAFGFRPSPSSIMGTGSITQTQEYRNFLKDTGRNERNPYGIEAKGIFGALARRFPGLVTYDEDPRQIAIKNRLAFDRYKNPFAERNILGQETGADMGAGIPRMGVQPGDRVQTPDGRVVTAQAKPLSGITAAATAVPYLGGIINFLAPKQAEIPGFEADNPMDTGANLGEDKQGMLNDMIDLFKISLFPQGTQTDQQVSSQQTQEVSPIQNVEPVVPTMAETILRPQGPPRLVDQTATQGFNQTNISTELDFPGTRDDVRAQRSEAVLGQEPKTVEQLRQEELDRIFSNYNTFNAPVRSL